MFAPLVVVVAVVAVVAVVVDEIDTGVGKSSAKQSSSSTVRERSRVVPLPETRSASTVCDNCCGVMSDTDGTADDTAVVVVVVVDDDDEDVDGAPASMIDCGRGERGDAGCHVSRFDESLNAVEARFVESLNVIEARGDAIVD